MAARTSQPRTSRKLASSGAVILFSDANDTTMTMHNGPSFISVSLTERSIRARKKVGYFFNALFGHWVQCIPPDRRHDRLARSNSPLVCSASVLPDGLSPAPITRSPAISDRHDDQDLVGSGRIGH